MIVSELIKKLEELPQDKTVLGRGYESGYNEIEEVFTHSLIKSETEWWDGDYQEVGGMNAGKAISIPKEYICLT